MGVSTSVRDMEQSLVILAWLPFFSKMRRMCASFWEAGREPVCLGDVIQQIGNDGTRHTPVS